MPASKKGGIDKAPTGIRGLDEITAGGLPRGRPTLFCGAAGAGKTLFGMEFLVRGAASFDEPGVFLAFEETSEELRKNVLALGFDLDDLVAQGKLAVDHIHIDRSEIEETGEYDLDGLFIRLGYAIDSIGAKRVVIDTLEVLFGALGNHGILRSELRRLFRWLKEKGVTAIITAERGEGSLTRQGLEEYVSDCVILLDHRVTDQVATRRIRVVKYRGSGHGTNEFPFIIGNGGIDVLPITSVGLDHGVSQDRVSSGLRELDDMLGGDGFYRGSSVLLSGTAGTGKTTLAASFAEATCRRGEKVVYFALEESPAQISRNLRSVRIELEHWRREGLLLFHASRPTAYGLETHLATVHKIVREVKPSAVIVDPITNFAAVGTASDVGLMLMRLIDFLKAEQITGFFTSLLHGTGVIEQTDVGVSSLIDTWLLLRDIECNGERNRGMYVLKSRGMAHSNQIREFLITGEGIRLIEPYLGPEGVLTGSARLVQETKESTEARLRDEAIARKQRELERKRRALEAQVSAMRAELELEEEEILREIALARAIDEKKDVDRVALARSRRARGSGFAEKRTAERNPS